MARHHKGAARATDPVAGGPRAVPRLLRRSAKRSRYAGRLPQPARRSSRRRKPGSALVRGLVVPGLHLAVLWSFAVAQPLLDVLGDAPEFFVARENTRADIVVLALGLTLVPPLIMVGIEVLASLVSLKLRRWVHLLFVAALAAAFLLQLLKDRPGGSAAVLIPVSVVAGLVLAALYMRTQLVPTLLTVLAPAPLVFVFVFLVISPVSKLVLPGKDVEASNVHHPGPHAGGDDLLRRALRLGPDGARPPDQR